MVMLLANTAAQAASEAFDLVVTKQAFNVPSGVSYEPTAPIVVELEVTNAGDETVDFTHARWQVRRVRELVGDPRDIWMSQWTDLDVIATGAFEKDPGLPEAIEPGQAVPMRFAFTPGQYGSFSVLIQVDPKLNRNGTERTQGGTTPLRLTTTAVIRQPAEGFRPLSPYQVGISEARHRRTREYFDLMGRWGFKQVRYGMMSVEQKDPSALDGNVEYDFGEIDSVVDALREHGIEAQIGMMAYGDGGFLDRPMIGDRLITYIGTRKANLLVTPEDLGSVGENGTWADWLYHLLDGRTDVFTSGFIRNEPWEGGSISNYHATAEYYRQVNRLAREVAKSVDPEFKIVGADSGMNTIDQFVMSGAAEVFDALTVHEYGTVYRGNLSNVIAETFGWPVYHNENWSGPSDAFVIIKTTNGLADGMLLEHPVGSGTGYLPLGVKRDYTLIAPRPLAQVTATMLHFIEDTRHAEDLSPQHTPHVHLFKAHELAVDPDKHAAVVFGRSPLHGPAFDPDRHDGVFFGVLTPGTMAIPDPDVVVTAYDLEGNELPRLHGTDTLDIPLTDQPYYLVSDNGYDDLRQRLVDAEVRQHGQPFQVEIDDFTSPLTSGDAMLTVRVTNRAATPRTAVIDVALPDGLSITSEFEPVLLEPGEQREVSVGVTADRSAPANRYPIKLTVRPEGGDAHDALVVEENLHESLIVHGTPTVDGDLSDWPELGARPVYITGGIVEVDPGEALWFPMDNLEADDASGMSARFAALWDETHFYVAAEVRDPTEDFRPSEDGGTTFVVHRDFPYLYWDNGRRVPLFRGARGDGLKLAFDVLPLGEKDQPLLPREAQLQLDDRFETLHPDHEIDLYPGRVNTLERSYDEVHADHLASLKDPSHPNHKARWPEFEGPTWVYEAPTKPEAWRFLAPGVPLHNAYPFSPISERDQKLLDDVPFELRRTPTGWVYEAAIPWTELSAVQPEVGKVVNFAFYVLDAGRQKLKWTDDRSAGAHRNVTMHPTWLMNQAIRTKWGFQPPADETASDD
ncbi:MAG: hypothetical protein AAGI46_03820 [Planctomycetota bacterium]